MPQRPNILFITCHDLGRHIGPYGISTVHTPTLNALAEDGVRLASHFCTSPGCSPSRAAIATGRYPHSNGVLGLAHAHFGWGLAPGERHAAALLAEAGYYPVLFGLQHVTYQVESLGFAEIHPERPADAVAERFESFLASRQGNPDPLYLEVNFFEPHRPFDFGGVRPDSSRGVYIPGYLPDTAECRAELAAMQGAIRKVDQCVARLLRALEINGRRDDTLVVFTADHGIAFTRAKGTLYDPGIETAFLAHWPAGGVTGGRVLKSLISNVDNLPTLLEAAGRAVPENIQGHSFLPLLRGEAYAYAAREAIFAEKTFHNEYDPLRCVRTERYKLIARFEASNPVEVPADIMRGATYCQMIPQVVEPRSQEFELYDLYLDPWEQQNLAGRPEVAEIERELKGRLVEWMRETEDPLLRGPVASPFYYRTLRDLESSS